ncbi:autotransporter outer membrane beta-barrel domain-containing protein [Fusobacterium varium]|uniref:autotransporter outer membrane beta-barrel domain-containing protein n=1 Tax=Fusobacterium varium TaxID=856 RepID=UPI003119C89E
MEKLIKVIKNRNKKKGINVVIKVVITFLLSSITIIGAEEILWIKNDGGIVKFSNNNSSPTETQNPYQNNEWNGNIYTNNITLAGKDSGYGLKLDGDLSSFDFVNNGIIIGTTASNRMGTGINIVNSSSVGTIINGGTIIGTTASNSLGTGIEIGSSKIKKIYNNGVIIGTTASDSYGSGLHITKSSIENIINSGLINANGVSDYASRGIGVIGISGNSNIINHGLINLVYNNNSQHGGLESAPGLGITGDANLKIVTNNGLIRVLSIDNGGSSSAFINGILIYQNSKVEDIKNNGIIRATASDNVSGIGIFDLDKEGSIVTNIVNKGLINGSQYGININQNSEVQNIINSGIIYGATNSINNVSNNSSNQENYGLLISGNTSEAINITSNKGIILAVGGGNFIYNDNFNDNFGKKEEQTIKGENYNIINVKAEIESNSNKIINMNSLELKNGILSYGTNETESISSNKKYILNGIENTLKVGEGKNELNNSIINAYGTAIEFGEGDGQLTLSGTIVNGGVYKISNIIQGSNNSDILILQSDKDTSQNTIINGNIDMGAGDDVLIIGDGTIINGTIDGGEGEDILNFGISSEIKSNLVNSKGINILHSISNFENINIGENTNITLFEKTVGTNGELIDLKVSGVKEINIKAGGVLNLRIDSQSLKNGKYEGHALIGNTGLMINGDTSKLPGGKIEITEIANGKYDLGVFNLITNGLGRDAIISMEGITLNKDLFVKTNSILDKATIIKNINGNEKEGDIKIEGGKDIFEINIDIPRDEQKYIKLNEIYKGIYSSTNENFNALKDILTLTGAGEDYTSVTDKEQMAILLSYLNNIYTASPYSFSSELSRKSVGMFKDIVTENQFRPDLNRWLIMGGLTHRDGGTKDTYYGKNYHGFDTGTADVDTDMKLTGAYALGKYGYSENITLGIVIGGNKSEAKLPMSKIKGNSGYIGAFTENYRGNLILKAGGGIQYSEYDASRATLGGHSYSDKYSDMVYDIYLNGRYSYNVGENLFLEPYGTLSYTYVDQEGVDEGSKVLAIETYSKSFDYTAAKVGVDLKKVIPHEKGKSTLSAGVSYTRLLNGADEENIIGKFKGENPSNFDILVAHKNENSIGLNAKYTLELENGILFDVKGSYSVEKNSHNVTGKNRAKGEWIVGAGIGYKF